MGEKTFSGTVDLLLNDTMLTTFNDIDLRQIYNAQAFINEDNSFFAPDSFTLANSEIMTAPSLRAVNSLHIPNSIVSTEADTDLNLEKLYLNTIPINSDLTIPIKGSLIFKEDVSLHADSTIGSLSNGTTTILPPLTIPDDLILTNTTAFSGSPGKNKVLSYW